MKTALDTNLFSALWSSEPEMTAVAVLLDRGRYETAFPRLRLIAP